MGDSPFKKSKHFHSKGQEHPKNLLPAPLLLDPSTANGGDETLLKCPLYTNVSLHERIRKVGWLSRRTGLFSALAKEYQLE